jgi:UDP-N-acetyl-D-glucosamine dehydrogenase
VAQLLTGMGADLRAADPHVVETDAVGSVMRVDATPGELSRADAVILLTDHDAFDRGEIVSHAAYVLDCRRVLSGANVETL